VKRADTAARRAVAYIAAVKSLSVSDW